MASAWSIGTTFTRPPLETALTTPEVIALSTPGSRVRFLKMGTATVLMWSGRLPRVPLPQPARTTAPRIRPSARPARRRRSATGHDVDEAARHHHHLRDAAAVEPRGHLVLRQGRLPDRPRLGPDRRR